MRKSRCSLALALGVIAAGTPGLPIQAGTVTQTLSHQGVARETIVVNAPAAKAAARPALIVLHGRRQASEPNRSSGALDALAAREGFVAVYPSALGGVWNWPTRAASDEIPLAKAGTAIADDLGFLTRLIDRLAEERIADPKRIYVSGASMGGFMTFALMCERSDRIAAGAALIASLTDGIAQDCKPARAVPVMLINGTLDRIVPYEGRKTAGGQVLSMLETLSFWGRLHGCRGQTESRLPAQPEAPGAGAGSGADPGAGSGASLPVLRLDFKNCRQDGAFRQYLVEGGGHTLPSLRPQGEDERRRFGPRSTAFETSAEVWGFLNRFKLP